MSRRFVSIKSYHTSFIDNFVNIPRDVMKGATSLRNIDKLCELDIVFDVKKWELIVVSKNN